MALILPTVAQIRDLLGEQHKNATDRMIVIFMVLTLVIKEQPDPKKAMQVVMELLLGSLKV